MRRLILPLLTLALAGCGGSSEPEAKAPADSTAHGGRIQSTVNAARHAGDQATRSVEAGQARIDSQLQEAAAQGVTP